MAQMVAHTLKAGQLIKNRVSGVSVQVSGKIEVFGVRLENYTGVGCQVSVRQFLAPEA
jgi:hypothetical protein